MLLSYFDIVVFIVFLLYKKYLFLCFNLNLFSDRIEPGELDAIIVHLRKTRYVLQLI